MTAELHRIASRVVWWKAPERVVDREDDFLCRVMALGDWADVNYVQAAYGLPRLRAALHVAPPGVFDPRSWHYWHRRLGLGDAPPLPERRFVIQAAPSTATFLVDRDGPIKVSFFGALRLGRVDDVAVCTDTGVALASLLDLAAQKVRVVQVRAERKDYLDIGTLIDEGISLPSALGAAQALYPDFAPLVTLKALSYFGDGDLSELPADIKERLAEAAAAVTDIPVVTLRGRTLC